MIKLKNLEAEEMYQPIIQIALTENLVQYYFLHKKKKLFDHDM